jgi:DNA anti-recombination protein RmuC
MDKLEKLVENIHNNMKELNEGSEKIANVLGINKKNSKIFTSDDFSLAGRKS